MAAIRSLILVVLASGSGLILLRRIIPNSSSIEAAVFGFILSNILLQTGLVLSNITNNYDVRYLPLVAPLALLRSYDFKQQKARQQALGRAGPISITVGWLLLLPQALAVGSAANLSGKGYFSLYTDLQYYINIAAESAHHAPRVMPYSATNEIRYTWLFSGLIGVWSHLIGLRPLTMLMVVWPIIFVLVAVTSVYLLTLRLFGEKAIAVVATLSFAVFGGPMTLPGQSYITASPFYSLSPTRDFANLGILLLVYIVSSPASIGYKIGRRSALRLIVISVISFTLAGTKGSTTLLLIGASCTSALLTYKTSYDSRRRVPLESVVICASAFIGQSLIVKADGALSFHLFSSQISRGMTIAQLPFNIIIYSATAMWCLMPLGLIIGPISENRERSFSGFLIGIPLAGFSGLAAFQHPGQSQLYFWQSCVPVLLICCSAVVVRLCRRFGKDLLPIILFSLACSVGLTLSIPTLSAQTAVVMMYVLLLLNLVAYVCLSNVDQMAKSVSMQRRKVWLRLGLAVLSPLSIIRLIPQELGRWPGSEFIPSVGGWQSRPENISANGWPLKSDSISNEYLSVLEWARLHTPTSSIFIVNKHCIAGRLGDANCMHFWMMASALSERRFLAETSSYTYNLDDGTRLMSLSDEFIESPNRDRFQTVRRLGVDYVMVDKREPFSRKLHLWGTIEFENEAGLILKLEPDLFVPLQSEDDL